MGTAGRDFALPWILQPANPAAVDRRIPCDWQRKRLDERESVANIGVTWSGFSRPYPARSPIGSNVGRASLLLRRAFSLSSAAIWTWRWPSIRFPRPPVDDRRLHPSDLLDDHRHRAPLVLRVTSLIEWVCFHLFDRDVTVPDDPIAQGRRRSGGLRRSSRRFRARGSFPFLEGSVFRFSTVLATRFANVDAGPEDFS